MRWKEVSGIMLTLLLISMLTLAFNVQPSKSTGISDSSWPMFQHDSLRTGRSEYAGPQSAEVSWISDVGVTVPLYTLCGSLQPVIGLDGVIYFGTGVGESGKLYAFNPNGTIRWPSADLEGCPGAPAISPDGTIFVGTSIGVVYTFNTDGTEKWRFYCEGRGPVSAITLASDGTLYFASGYRLYALDPDGTEKWFYQCKGYVQHYFTTPAQGPDRTIYAVYPGWWTGTDQDHGWLHALNPDGTRKWLKWLDGFHMSAPSVGSDGTVYVAGDGVHAFYPNGTLKWIGLLAPSIGKWCSRSWITVGPDGVLIAGGSGYQYSILRAFSLDGNVLWSFEPEEDHSNIVQGSIVDAEGTVFVQWHIYGWNSRIYSINSAGTVKWAHDVPGYFSYSSWPAIGANGYLYIAIALPEDDQLQKAKLYCFGPAAPVNKPPRASFTFSPQKPIVGESVRFDASDSWDPDGDIVSYRWEFGDSSPPVTEVEPTTKHTYSAEGWYNVTLTVTDDKSATCNTNRWVRVTTNWTFAIVTDLHIGWGEPDYGADGFDDGASGQDYWLTDRLKGIVEWVNLKEEVYNIHFVVVLGDIADTAECSEFHKAREILNELNVPYIPVIGNHDVWPYTVKDQPFDPDLTRWNKEYRWESNDYGDNYFNEIFWEQNYENLIKISVLFNDSWSRQYTDFHELQDTHQMALLQNYVFTYKGIKIITLDFVERKLDSGGPKLFSETKAWLIENLEEGESTILLSHHPIHDGFRAFSHDDASEIRHIIDHSDSYVQANFAGHNHDNDEVLPEDNAAGIRMVSTEAVCRESTWWDPWAKSGNNIRIVTMLGEEIENYSNFGNIGDETMEVPRWIIRLRSPTDMSVTDPEGFTITKEVGEVAGMSYFEFDIDGDGKLDDIVVLEELKIGDYHITVIPEPDASPTDTYTLEFLGIDITITLAENVQIINIPTQPYMVRSTETEVIPIIPATVDLDPETLNLESEGQWVTVYIELPVGHGYNVSMIDVGSLWLTGQVQAEVQPIEIGDYDGDNIADLMVKFNRTDIQSILEVGEKVVITITGVLIDGRSFEGRDAIRVIDE